MRKLFWISLLTVLSLMVFSACAAPAAPAGDSGDAAAASEAFKSAVPMIDSAARKGLIHVNKAARHKQRLNLRIKALAAA